MCNMGSWFLATLLTYNAEANGVEPVNFGMVKYPHPEGVEAGTTLGTVTSLGVNVNSEKKDLAIILLQTFSAFGVFLMKQFYEGVPTELCEAARIDGLSEYGICAKIMLPLSLPAVSTLVIFTFVNTWNDFLGPLIYLTKNELKTIQIGLRMFISQYSAEYGLIMAASVIALIPVLIVFLFLQKYFVQGIASTGLKG